MKTHVLRGSKQDIVDSLSRIAGDVREAIVFVEEAAPKASDEFAPDADGIFAEVRPHMVDADGVDDSRQTIYTRLEGE